MKKPLTQKQFLKLFRDSQSTLRAANACKVPSVKHDRLMRKFVVMRDKVMSELEL